MTQEERQKYLEQLAKSTEGVALKEYFNILISRLTDARNFKADNFEIDGKASLKAAAVLQKIVRDLENFAKPKVKRKPSQYQ